MRYGSAQILDGRVAQIGNGPQLDEHKRLRAADQAIKNYIHPYQGTAREGIWRDSEARSRGLAGSLGT